MSALEDRLRPLVQAELSVLVDVLHRPELLFPENTDARRKCESGGFISKSVSNSLTSTFTYFCSLPTSLLEYRHSRILYCLLYFSVVGNKI